MSQVDPTPEELRAAVRLLRGSEAFSVVLNWLHARQEKHMRKLLDPEETGAFRFIQGRAIEVAELLKSFKET